MFTLIVISVFVAENAIGQNSPTQNGKILDGSYAFVSEKTELTKPVRLTENRRGPQWSGLFFFLNNRFSISLMNSTRNPDWFTSFPRNLNELGYESFAGTYEVKESMIVMRPEIQLHPFYDRRVRRFEFRVSGKVLTLTETIMPIVEDLSEGKRTIILSKL